MHVNVTPLHVTIESTAQCVHMSKPTSQLVAFDRQEHKTDSWMMKFKVISAGISPAEVGGGEHSGASPFEDFIFALNY